jgi:hypothetical protein
LPASQRGPTQYFDKTDIVAPSNAAQPLGNAGRNIAIGFPLYNLDLGVLQLRLTFFSGYFMIVRNLLGKKLASYVESRRHSDLRSKVDALKVMVSRVTRAANPLP